MDLVILFVSVFLILLISAFCSLAEASLYAVRMPYVRQLADSGSAVGNLLAAFKRNMERPITAILIINTTANTAGAAIAGAQAQSVFGASWLWLFSLTLTLGVLFLAEIMPKVIGVAYNSSVACFVAFPLSLAIKALLPMVWFVQRVARFFRRRKKVFSAPEEEVQSLAFLSAEEGSILPMEANLVQNVLKLNDVRTRDIMTPRSVTFMFPADATLREVSERCKECTFSRIPVYEEDDPETWVGFVLTREVLSHLASDQFDITLRSLCKPLYFVSENTPAHVLLRSFLRRRTHLFGVMHEHGGLVGIVTLEDVLESIIGEEIVDEVDTVVDLQELARFRHRQQFREANADEQPPDD